MTRVPMRLFMILVLGLHLAIDLCHGFGIEELCKQQYCNADAAKNCNCPAENCNGPSMGPSESTTFSCSDCSPGTMYLPYVCKNCYEGTEENEAFSCQRCKFGRIKSKPVICDACESNPTPESDSGFHNIVILIFDPLNNSALMLFKSNRRFV